MVLWVYADSSESRMPSMSPAKSYGLFSRMAMGDESCSRAASQHGVALACAYPALAAFLGGV